MLRKKLLLLLLLLTLLVSVSTTENARACSGDNCDCGIDAQICQYDCQFEPPQYQQACRHGCISASVQCARACCSGGGGGPLVF
ncbi:MAG: hypothetical protein ABW250_22355 [Pyrinomonadaceae bacterium]